MIELSELNNEIFQITEKYEHINSNYVIEPPIISSDKKVRLEEDEDEDSTESKKRIRMKK
jgi:hypothetical protein